MVRRLAISLTLAVVAVAALVPALAAGMPQYTASKWTALVKVARCSRALDEAVFHGKMRRVEDTNRMAMRFTLLERTGLDGFQRVDAPKLGKWRRSRAGVGAFGYRQVVRGLEKGAVYRVRVDYRWFDEDGAIVSRARRRSSTCPNAWALPNLRVRVTGVRRTQNSDSDRYFMKVTNFGRAPAEGVLVRLSVDGIVAGTVTVPTLYARTGKSVSLRGPECASWVQAQVDPDGAIAETAEQDNTHQLDCEDLQLR
ncbi:MAG TPA: CARDB domain-containing protein [Thermoleophilaceae bacterium]|nr:CARDB domain-containing protein [Thermoleophilaceae bacterium]